MFELIPVAYYSTVFLLSSCVLLWGQVIFLNASPLKRLHAYNENYFLFLLAVVVTLYIGLRSQDAGVMGDTRTYANYFQAVDSSFLEDSRDYGFYAVMLGVKELGLGATAFFVLIAALYVGGIARSSALMLKPCGILLFIAFLTSFKFWAWGINTIRNGVAIAVFMWGLSEYFFKNRKLGWCLILISFLFHKSVLLLVVLFILTNWLRDKTKLAFAFWCICFLLSLIAGHFFEDLFVQTGLISADYWESGGMNKEFSVTGYRYDFVMYSLVPIAIGYYFIFRKRCVSDIFYNTIISLYLYANGLWLLINQHWLSDRFANLSWCWYPVLLVYPVAAFCAKNVKAKVSLVLLGQAGFSLLMWSIDKYH